MKRSLMATTVLLLVGSLVASQLAVANFNAATGFSGKHGFTCTSCHNVPDRGPAGEDEVYDEPATVTLDGLPAEWTLRGTYNLTVTVTGGPPAAPSPAPQGGFEIEADGGLFLLPDEGAELIEIYSEDGRAVTYTVEGTQVRQWNLVWRAPDLPPAPGEPSTERWDPLTAAPAPITFWVAAMAANGNHVIGGPAAGGELGDSVDNITVTVPPSQAAVDAWMEYRLLPPLVDGETLADRYVTAFEPFTVSGTHWDDDATILAYSLDEMPWESIPTPGSDWRLEFGTGLTPGEHTLLLRSESDDGRISDVSTVQILVQDDAGGDVQTPFPILLAVGGLLAAVGWRRRR